MHGSIRQARQRASEKFAVTDASPLAVHVDPFALGHPSQDENTYPDPGDAVRVTVVESVKLPEQLPGQLIEPGELVTVPEPLTPTFTV